MVDVRHDDTLASKGVGEDKEGAADEEDGLLREDWLKDPSHLFESVEEFQRLRTCSNVISSIAFSMMNKVNVQVANRIHKHARINHELIYRIQENLEHTHSFTDVFLTNINKYMKTYTS